MKYRNIKSFQVVGFREKVNFICAMFLRFENGGRQTNCFATSHKPSVSPCHEVCVYFTILINLVLFVYLSFNKNHLQLVDLLVEDEISFHFIFIKYRLWPKHILDSFLDLIPLFSTLDE